MFGKIIVCSLVLACMGAAKANALIPVAPVPRLPCNDKIYAVDAANLEMHGGNITITAQGTASTAGWKNIWLRFDSLSADGKTVIYSLVGCAPEIAAEVLTAVSARDDGVMLPASVRQIRIVARSNSQTLDIDEFRNPVHAN